MTVGATLALAELTQSARAGDQIPLKFDRIDLSDGRRLINVVVKSYDAKSEKLLVIADGKAMTFPIALLPAPFNERLKAAPSSGNSVSTTSTPRPVATAADQYSSGSSAVVAAPQVIYVTPSAAQAPVRKKTPKAGATAQAASAAIAKHAAAAQTRATNYFRYEFQIGSNSITVTSLNFEFGTPKPVAGWDGRYETQGKAFLEFYDSKGGSFQRTTSTFEVITEEKPGEEMTVVEFRRKS